MAKEKCDCHKYKDENKCKFCGHFHYLGVGCYHGKGKEKLQELCGEYNQTRYELLKLKTHIVGLANRLGLGKDLELQMDW